MGKRIINILSSPLVISAFLAAVIIFLLPSIFNKYNSNLTVVESTTTTKTYDYRDLDGDGYTEKIEIITSYNDLVQLQVQSERKTIDQWNFKGKLIRGQNPFYGDINLNNLKEILLLTYFDEKIYLNSINPVTKEDLIKNKFITEYRPVTDETDCGVHLCGLYDLNQDGINEIYFALSTSFSLFPRKMFSYDPANDTLFASANGCSIIEEPIACDFESDDNYEFICESAAVGNCDSKLQYNDHFSWLMVFDEKMNFKFDPVKISSYPSRLLVKPLFEENGRNILALNLYEGDQNYPSFFALYNKDGIKIREKVIDYLPKWKNSELFQHENDFNNVFVVNGIGEIFKVDSRLNLIPVRHGFPLSKSYKFSIDIDGDDINEVVFCYKNLNKLLITRNDFSDPVAVDVPGNNDILKYAVLFPKNRSENGEVNPYLYIEGDENRFYISYYENPLYYFKYLLYAGIYSLAFLFVWGIQKTQSHRVKQKFEVERQMARLQLKAIKNQVDPHFTLNIINSIASLFYKKDKNKADYIFGKYSKLLRSTLLSSEQIITTLKEEIEYVGNYLGLEKYRMNNKFDYNIEIDPNIDVNTTIPRMLLHTFVENAIKHGIKHLETNGKIDIIAKDVGGTTTVIKIMDNGIGRTKAKELSEYSTGKGLEIIDQIIDLYYKLEKKRIKYEIADRKDQTGTGVTVTLIHE